MKIWMWWCSSTKRTTNILHSQPKRHEGAQIRCHEIRWNEFAAINLAAKKTQIGIFNQENLHNEFEFLNY